MRISNNIKIIGITLYVLNKYDFLLLLDLYKDKIKKTITKKQYLLGLILFNSYKISNNLKNDIIFMIVDSYIKNHSSKFFRYLVLN